MEVWEDLEMQSRIAFFLKKRNENLLRKAIGMVKRFTGCIMWV